MVWLADYEAWGNVNKEIWREVALETLQVDKAYLQPFRFQGQSFDSETGLHYNRFRYYDPDMGMFISRDPIGLMGGENVFAYAPNPTGWIDPLGLFEFHGNWCGPNWTGGRKAPYDRNLDDGSYYAAPISQLDTACQQHDICYERCRVNFGCIGGAVKENCMIECDDVLVDASESINNDDSSSTTRWFLEVAIGGHMGVDDEIEKTCPNYEKTFWEKLLH